MKVEMEVLAMANKVLLATKALKFNKVTPYKLGYLISLMDFKSNSVRNVNNFDSNLNLIKDSLGFLVVNDFFDYKTGDYYPTINANIYCSKVDGASFKYLTQLEEILKSKKDIEQEFFIESQKYMNKIYQTNEVGK